MASAGNPSFSSVLASTSHMRFVDVKISVLSVGLFWQRRSRPISSRFLPSSSQRITCCVMFGLIVSPSLPTRIVIGRFLHRFRDSSSTSRGQVALQSSVCRLGLR